ncbi:Uncharacterised protein [Vibrio cholerae]|nr:Uncharacterised protein [Vibrio cholerae]CSC76036.1 Uncharacterised protein [Vibrio cholerae]CSH94042.1 Uncharacterised protein [Vibrio cholerae]CSI64085.1 Uncharacterised protein [Vibrio cholerae]
MANFVFRLFKAFRNGLPRDRPEIACRIIAQVNIVPGTILGKVWTKLGHAVVLR